MKLRIKEKAQTVVGYVEVTPAIINILLDMIDNAKKDPASIPEGYIDSKYVIDVVADS